ncbi:hypothetical protein OWC53_08355 [Pectobacterium brasiliense]|nr:hypothetical protein [Pectobacterium brasiliense]WGL29541.1 hypothetical protein OWC53_08355 [Pectobacterium brasiliense]
MVAEQEVDEENELKPKEKATDFFGQQPDSEEIECSGSTKIY